ncbi:hypothetical protein VNO77_27719 [Canavalia gladiata]|uniref:Uncharacterized protein n=1 Tax=Canavalia gladiata TaxID=3824 RepID=A0AAN9KXT3_CANGL
MANFIYPILRYPIASKTLKPEIRGIACFFLAIGQQRQEPSSGVGKNDSNLRGNYKKGMGLLQETENGSILTLITWPGANNELM